MFTEYFALQEYLLYKNTIFLLFANRFLPKFA